MDAIYRRAVTSDIMKHYEEVGDFIAAVKDNAVCLIGDFRTQIAHNKILYKILHLPQTQAFLTEEENAFVKAHVPMTCDANEWKEHFYKERNNADSTYLIQEFCVPYQTMNIDLAQGEHTFFPVYNLTGLFTYGGKFRGVYSRISKSEIISTQYSEMALPTLFVTQKKV